MWRRLVFFVMALSSPLVADEMLDDEPLQVQPYNYGKEFLKVVLGLIALLAIIILLAYLLRRFAYGRIAMGRSGSRIQILEHQPLNSKNIVYLIEVDGQKSVVGVSPQGIHPIASLNLDQKAQWE